MAAPAIGLRGSKPMPPVIDAAHPEFLCNLLLRQGRGRRGENGKEGEGSGMRRQGKGFSLFRKKFSGAPLATRVTAI